MGAEVCRAVDAAEDLDLVAAIDPSASGQRLSEVVGLGDSGVEIAGEIDALARCGTEVAVDFTVAEAARANLEWCARHGVHAVCGTTGLGADDLSELEQLLVRHGRANAVLAANFALSAVLLMHLAALVAPYLDGVEIIELHHEHKIDAPSGTAIETARRVAAARAGAGVGPFVADPTRVEHLEGARGAVGAGDIRIHAVRLPGLVAHQQVIFGALGQSLTLRQDSYDRRCFMPGVLLAIRRVPAMPGLTVGLGRLLGLEA